MNSKQHKTLKSVLGNPVSAGIRWTDIESLLLALGATIEEAQGSRIAVNLKGVYAVFHRPHPRPTADKGAVKSVRRFLINAGVDPK
ncbi:MAG: type II toxin-antitoxin system HicA family toxin [Desulfomonilaceae bacterium]